MKDKASIVAIVRQVSDSIANCELTHIDRAPIDLAKARRQHSDYVLALESLGCEVVVLPQEPSLPDSVFVEDTALVFPEIAVITNPGASSRRPETTVISETLRRFRDLVVIEPPGTLDGGDVLRVGRTLFVGKTSRSNAPGIGQLADIASHMGYETKAVDVSGCLHLKTAVTAISDNTLLMNRDFVDVTAFEAYDLVFVDPSEPMAANLLPIGASVMVSEQYPRTLERLKKRGLEPIVVNTIELAKAEGGLTCCSLIIEGG